MSYGIDQNTGEGSTSAGPIKPQKGGVNNVKLVSWEFGTIGKTDYEALQFNFEDESGRFYREAIFPVNESREREYAEKYPRQYKAGDKKGQTITPEEAVELAHRQVNEKIKALLVCFTDPEKLVIEGGSFEALAKNTCKHLDGVETDIPLKIKLVYDNKNKITTPRYDKWVMPQDSKMPFKETAYDKYEPELSDENQSAPVVSFSDDEDSVGAESDADELPTNF